jgi:hypothetical protein
VSCPESEAPPRIASCEELETSDTDRAPPMTDSQKLDAIYSMVSSLFDATQADRQRIAGLEGRMRMIETAHNYRHPGDADRELEFPHGQV